ncbi:MAG: hypothetical protein JNN03_18600 [Rubrivivax sp.]|nr:hypothetical protein [Rubrivivax sp.]
MNLRRLPALLLTACLATSLVAPPADASVALRAARAAAAKRAMEKEAVIATAATARNAAPVAQIKPRDVIIRRSRHPGAADHIEHAQRHGQPTILHIDRPGASARRAASTGSVDRHRKPAPSYERDEYPPAFTREGGHNANVRYVDRKDNRGAGATMGAQTRDLPDGARIRVIVTD